MSGLRKFDHDEAYQRWLSGEPPKAIAASYGVDRSAIAQLITRRDPARHEAEKSHKRTYQRDRHRKPCVRRCGRLAWHGPNPERTGVCLQCSAAERTTTVRDAELLCTTCGEWKPDDAFPRSKGNAGMRRGRHALCRACQTSARQAYRERHKVPCDRCGKPRLPKSEKSAGNARRHLNDSGLCAECFAASIRKAAA